MQGSVDMVAAGSGRIRTLLDQGLPVDIVWNEALLLPWTAMVIPKDAPHPDAAFAMVDLMAQPDQQAALATTTLYGPTNPAALKQVEKSTLDKLPTSPEHLAQACQLDLVALGDQYDEYAKRYAAWVANE